MVRVVVVVGVVLTFEGVDGNGVVCVVLVLVSVTGGDAIGW